MKKLLLGLCFLVLLLSIHVKAGADIRSDIAAGMPLSQVVLNGLAAGLTIEDVVTRCIAAGVDCVSVVQAAIAVKATSAYSIIYAAVKARPERTGDIVRAALSIPGINPGSVITAAATGDPAAVEDIRTAAQEEAVPETVVLAAITAAIGSTQPGFTASSAGVGGIGGTGGVGGGGQASPSR